MKKYSPAGGPAPMVNGAEKIGESDASFKGQIGYGASMNGMSMADLKRGSSAPQRFNAKSDPADPA